MNQNIKHNLAKAKLLIQHRNLVEALAILEPLYAKHPNEFGVVSMLGMGYMAARREKEALNTLSHASALNPGNINVNNAIAIILARNGEYDQALEFFDWTLRLDPLNTEALQNKGGTLIQLGRYDEAVQTWAKMGKEAEESIEVQYCLGVIYEYQNDLDKARRHYQQVLMLPDETDRHGLARSGLARIAGNDAENTDEERQNPAPTTM